MRGTIRAKCMKSHSDKRFRLQRCSPLSIDFKPSFLTLLLYSSNSLPIPGGSHSAISKPPTTLAERESGWFAAETFISGIRPPVLSPRREPLS